MELKDNSISMSLYDINKAAMQGEQAYTKKDCKKAVKLINAFYEKFKSPLFMLLGKDLGYYTILEHAVSDDPKDSLGHKVFECLENVGVIYSVEEILDNPAIEIWVKIEDEFYCLYLFDYQAGRVYFGG